MINEWRSFWVKNITVSFEPKILRVNKSRIDSQAVWANRGRHPGQGPRDPAVPVPETPGLILKSLTAVQDSNSKFAGSGIGTGTEIWKIRDPELGPGRIKKSETGTGTEYFFIRDRDFKRDWKFSGTRSRSSVDLCEQLQLLRSHEVTLGQK